MTEILKLLIENYDLSDIINQLVILCLVFLLISQAHIKIRLRKPNPHFY